MKANQVAHGFFGGLIGLAFAAPLFVHWSWMETIKFRLKNPTTRFQFYLGSILILPLSVIVGLLSSAPSTAYFAYQCYKDNSLDPIVKIVKAPYQEVRDEQTRHEININRGILIGYTVVLTLMAFAVLNIVTGGLFGFFGAAGASIATIFGVGEAGVFTTSLFTLGVSYLGGLFGGFSAGALSWANTPINEELYVATNNQQQEPLLFIDEYDQNNDNFSNPSYTTHTFMNIPRVADIANRWDQLWNKSNEKSGQEMEYLHPNNEEDEEEEVIYFDLNDRGPTTQKTSPEMRQ